MSGEADLEAMLAHLSAHRRPGTFAVFTSTASLPDKLVSAAHARVDEAEGITLVVPADMVRADMVPADASPPEPGLHPNGSANEPAKGSAEESARRWAWLTLDVHSALNAVGLTAAVSQALAERGIACNMLAGFFHDHLLVPLDRADDALDAIRSLARTAGGGIDA